VEIEEDTNGGEWSWGTEEERQMAGAFSTGEGELDDTIPSNTRNLPLVGPGVWKLYPGALTEELFCISMRDVAQQIITSTMFREVDHAEKWDYLKDRLRSHARANSIKTGFRRKQLGRKMTDIQQQLDNLNLNNEADRQLLPNLYGDLYRYHTLLHMDETRRSQGAKVTREMCRPNVPFPRRPNFIKELKSEDGISERKVQRKGDVVLQFYTTLFSIHGEFDVEKANRLLDTVPVSQLLRDTEIQELRTPISEEELEKTLSQCAANSSLGVDGLPFEFWKCIGKSVIPILAEQCRRLMEHSTSEAAWPMLLGTLLHKKGDVTLLSNYRMLSVMDMDLR
jgi:hypothetical protein